jgi:hypothetical protein
MGDGFVFDYSTGALTQTLSDFTITGAISDNVISLPSTSLEILDIQDATITNSDAGDLIYHANDSVLTLDNVTLNQTGTGDAVVFASTTAQTQTFSGISIDGNVTDGALIALPSTSLETLTISDSTFTNTGAGNVIGWASSTDLTIDTGAVIENTGTGNAISVEAGSGNLDVIGILATPVTVNASGGFALTTNGESFGSIDFEYTESNAPFIIKLIDTDATGDVAFSNNTLTFLNSTSTDADAGGGTDGLIGIGLLVTGTGNQLLTVSAFNSNEIDITNNIVDQHIFALDVESFSNNPVTFTAGIQDNIITVTNDVNASASTEIIGFYNADLSLDDDFSGNQITVTGDAGTDWGDMSAMSTQDIFVINSSDFTDNTLLLDHGGGRGAGWFQSTGGDASIDGDFSNNTFTIINDTNSSAWLSQGGAISITGDLSGNQFIADDNGDNVYGWTAEGDITITGNVTGNTFNSSNNNVAGGWLINNTTTIIGGNVTGNTFTSSNNNLVGRGLFLFSGTMDITGDVTGNTFISSDNGRRGFGILEGNNYGDLTITGNFSSNDFTINENGSASVKSNRGVYLGSDATFEGLVNNNTINITDSISAENAGFYIEIGSGETITFDQTISGNTITINSDTTGNYGFDLSATATSGGITFTGNSQSDLSSLNSNASILIDATNNNVIFGS